ncbi:Uncharacterised protein [Pseudomonas putida]|nr:Uncharacterised protein [Pseudomonas putida]
MPAPASSPASQLPQVNYCPELVVNLWELACRR